MNKIISKICKSKMICKGSIDIFGPDPFEGIHFESINKTDGNTDERKDEIKKRIKIIKMFKDEEMSYEEVISIIVSLLMSLSS